MDFAELRKRAYSVVNPRKLSDCADAGGVGAAILTKAGNVYLGVCIDTCCSMGFCAEHAAAAAMITAGEQEIEKVVAVGSDGHVMPPCGRCREFLMQLSDQNQKALVLVDDNTVLTLGELLPYYWKCES